MRQLAGTCYRCGQPGHYSYSCPGPPETGIPAVLRGVTSSRSAGTRRATRG